MPLSLGVGGITVSFTYVRIAIHTYVPYLVSTQVPLQQIILNLYTKSGPIQRMSNLISNFTPFSILELCPCSLKLKVGAFMSYGHILPFLCYIYKGLAPVILVFIISNVSVVKVFWIIFWMLLFCFNVLRLECSSEGVLII